MAIYTKKGDGGMTATFKSKRRLLKSSQIFKTLGAIDEANSFLGIVSLKLKTTTKNLIIEEIQGDLMTIGSIVAGANLRLNNKKTKRLEREIDKMEKELPPLKNFILPGGGEIGAHLMYARTLVRRVEREVVELIHDSRFKIYASMLKYLNRLSDYLFVLARWENHKRGIKERVWKNPKV